MVQPQSKQVVLMTLEVLFKLPKLPSENSSYTEGQRYMDNFLKRGGLEILEDLQENGNDEIYELSYGLMRDFFGEHLQDDLDNEDTKVA